jgi:hypothetical protein
MNTSLMRHPEILLSGYYKFLCKLLGEFLIPEIANIPFLLAISGIRNLLNCPIQPVDRKKVCVTALRIVILVSRRLCLRTKIADHS